MSARGSCLLMFAGCLFLWIGVPLLWLWIASQIEGATDLGIALAVAMVGSISTIILIAWAFPGSTAPHRVAAAPRPRAAEAWEQRRRRRPTGGVLEPMIVSSAALAVVLFAVWFLFFAGASPVPLNIGY